MLAARVFPPFLSVVSLFSYDYDLIGNLVPRVLSLLRESTLVAAGHVSARFLQIPEM